VGARVLVHRAASRLAIRAKQVRTVNAVRTRRMAEEKANRCACTRRWVPMKRAANLW